MYASENIKILYHASTWSCHKFVLNHSGNLSCGGR